MIVLVRGHWGYISNSYLWGTILFVVVAERRPRIREVAGSISEIIQNIVIAPFVYFKLHHYSNVYRVFNWYYFR